MKLEHSFEVEAPLERVWARLIDIEKVAPCLPGAEITDVLRGRASTRATSRSSSARPPRPTPASCSSPRSTTTHHRVTMSANGRDKRGQGSAKATISSSMSEADGTTHVDVVTDFTLTGRLARFGRGGMIEDVSNKMVGDFVECLRSSLESEGSARRCGEAGRRPRLRPQPPQAAQPVRGGRLFLSVLWMRIKRLFGAR